MPSTKNLKNQTHINLKHFYVLIDLFRIKIIHFLALVFLISNSFCKLRTTQFLEILRKSADYDFLVRDINNEMTFDRSSIHTEQ